MLIFSFDFFFILLKTWVLLIKTRIFKNWINLQLYFGFILFKNDLLFILVRIFLLCKVKQFITYVFIFNFLLFIFESLIIQTFSLFPLFLYRNGLFRFKFRVQFLIYQAWSVKDFMGLFIFIFFIFKLKSRLFLKFLRHISL